MGSQVTNGKAFEWAVGIALSEHSLVLKENKASKQNNFCYEKADNSKRMQYLESARCAVQHILEKELIKTGEFEFLNDAQGKDGDVRDIVIISNSRIIGISCKTNHDAYKHSRLSDKLDFVKKWELNSEGCSENYFQNVQTIFGKLRAIKVGSNSTAKWDEQPNVPQDYYWPVLDVFENEIRRVVSPNMCKNFICYLIGKHDFYKIIARKKRVEIQGFNINGMLKVSQLLLPDKILDCQNKNGSQYSKTIWFNEGWTFNFRIHNASSRVEPSLKFDIATGLPSRLYQHHIDI